MKWHKKGEAIDGYTDFSFVKNGMEFVSDSEANEYFDDENEILFQASLDLNEQKD